MIPVYPRFNVTSFKILFIHETFFVFQFFFSLFFDDIPYLLEKLPQRKVTSNKIFRVFFIWGGGGNGQPSIYADLFLFRLHPAWSKGTHTHNNTHEEYYSIFHSFFSSCYTR